MRRIFSRLNQQRGQVLVMFVGIFTLVTIFGVMVVDVGIWYAQRRGAQTDADLPALAGARECMLQLATEDFGSHDPYPAIVQWFNDNNDNGSGDSELVDDGTSTQCFDPSDGGPCGSDSAFCCVDVTVRDTTTTTFFSSLFSPIFEHVPGNMGAHARACAGAANNPGHVVPLEIYTEKDGVAGPCFNDDGSPRLGEICPIKVGSADENPRGLLDLTTSGNRCSDSGGSGSIEDLIQNGADGMCLINEAMTPCDPSKGGPWYDCAAVQTGTVAGNILDGMGARLATPTLCGDALSDVVNETSPGVYEPRDCDPGTDGVQVSPRLITLIVFDYYPDDSSNTGYPIIGFAGFYVEGCAWGNDEADVTPENLDPMCDRHGGSTGHAVIYGRLLNLVMAGTGIGGADESATEFGIALVDWEGGGGGTPGPTSAPTATSVPPTSTPQPTVCHGSHCPTDTPQPTDTPRPPTATPVPTGTPFCPTPVPCTDAPGQCKKTPTPTPGPGC